VSRKLTGLAASDFNDPGKAACEELAAVLSDLLSKDENARLGQIRIDSGAPDDPSAIDGAFVSLAMDEAGLTVALIVVADPHGDVFADLLSESSTRKTLEALEDFDLVVIDRQPENIEDRYLNKQPKWKGQPSMSERLRIPVEDLDESAIEALGASIGTLDRRWERIGFKLIRSWPADVCVAKGEGLLAEIADALRALAPVVGRVNYRARQAKMSKAPALERASWRKPS